MCCFTLLELVSEESRGWSLNVTLELRAAGKLTFVPHGDGRSRAGVWDRELLLGELMKQRENTPSSLRRRDEGWGRKSQA